MSEIVQGLFFEANKVLGGIDAVVCFGSETVLGLGIESAQGLGSGSAQVLASETALVLKGDVSRRFGRKKTVFGERSR